MALDDCIKGVIAGTLVGVLLGVLYAPKKGKETRQDLCDATGKMIDNLKGRYEEGKKRLKEGPAGGETDPDAFPEPCNECL